MTETQKLLITCLKYHIHNDSIAAPAIDFERLSDLLVEARNHGLELLVADAVTYQMSKTDEENQVLCQLKSKAMLTVLKMKAMQLASHGFLNALNASDVDYVILKGLGHQMLYRNPSIRSYGDIDILVGENQLTQVDSILCKLGYSHIKTKDESYHVSYQHMNYLPIEVHYKVSPIVGEGGHSLGVSHLLRSKQVKYYEGIKFYVLGADERIAYNMMHLSKHVHYEGFGFRQLLDIHYIVNVGEIDWSKTNALLKTYGISNFSRYILTLCQRLFEVDYGFETHDEMDEGVYSIFESFVADSGLFGHQDEHHYTDALLSKYATDQNLKDGNKLRYIRTMLFPSSDMMPVKYNYAKKWVVLLPIAWLHRLFYELRFNPKRIRKVLKADPHVASMERHYKLREAFGLVRE